MKNELNHWDIFEKISNKNGQFTYLQQQHDAALQDGTGQVYIPPKHYEYLDGY